MNYVAIWVCGGRTNGMVLEGEEELKEHIISQNSLQHIWKYYELGDLVETSIEFVVKVNQGVLL
jgi:hypothetical protein